MISVWWIALFMLGVTWRKLDWIERTGLTSILVGCWFL